MTDADRYLDLDIAAIRDLYDEAPGAIMEAVLRDIERAQAMNEPDAPGTVEEIDALLAAIDLMVDRLVRTNERRPYRLIEEGYEYDTVLARSLSDAADMASEEVDAANYDVAADTIWVDCRAECIMTEEDERRTVTLDPPAPDCAGDREHDWRSPHKVVGGIAENPGVQGHGGGVVVTEVCAHCGAYRVTDTWAQRSDTGEQGLESVAYSDADYASLAWLRRSRIDAAEERIDAALDALDCVYRYGRDRDGDGDYWIEVCGDEPAKEDIEAVETAIAGALDVSVNFVAARPTGGDCMTVSIDV